MNEDQRDEVVQLYLDDIIPNRFQPREVFDEQALKELAVSIREHGVIQPIIVRNMNGKYEIIAGERRYKASALAGMTKIPAIIRNLDDKESSKVALLENLQRKNLNPIEEARTYQKIIEIDDMTQEELAKTMGKSQSSVANKLRLLSLPEEIQDALLKEDISERHARALINVSDTKIQKGLLDKIKETKMSVRSLEEEIKTLYPKGKDVKDIPIDSAMEASANSFLDSKPLSPTIGEVAEEQTSNYGKVVIAPPKEFNKEEEDTTSKFINYGEDEENKDPFGIGLDLGVSGIRPDVNEIRQNSTSIGQPTSGAALDNMLNIRSSEQPVQNPSSQDYFKIEDIPLGVSSALAAEPTPSPVQLQTPSSSDNTISSIKIPSIVTSNQEEQTLSTSQEQTESTGPYTVEQATERIQKVVEEIRNHGITINADEMNFPKSYQVIIKIDKA